MDILKKDRFYFVCVALVFALGVYLRLKAYFFNVSFWHDEAALALNVSDRSFLNLLLPLDFDQCAPFGFLCLSKILVSFFGVSEYVFRLIPLVSGVLAIFCFYFLSKEVLKNKWVILFSNLLFCINFRLIYFSQEFKQYSLEVLITIILIILLSKLTLKSPKEYIFLGLIFFLSFLFVMPAPFILGGYFVYLIYKNSKKALGQIFYTLLPFLMCSLPYYFFVLKPAREIMVNNWSELWNMGYLSFELKGDSYLFIKLFRFLFNVKTAHYYSLLSIVLCLIGGIFIIKERKKAGAIVLGTLGAAFLACALHIYPIWDRVSLYLFPLILLVSVKPLEYINFKAGFKKGISSLIILILAFSMFRANSVKQFLRINSPKNYARYYTREIVNKISPGDEVIYIGSYPAYIYYARKFGTDKNPLGGELAANEYKYYEKILNFIKESKKGKTYWIICCSFNRNPEDIKEETAYIFSKKELEKTDAKILFDKKKREINHFAIKYKI